MSDGLLEGPRTDEQNRLYYSDVRGGGVFRRNPDGRIEALIRQRPGDSNSQNVLLASGVDLNERFAYTLHLSPGGMLSISLRHEGKRYSHQRRISASWSKMPLYFKAGSYVQDNDGSTREGARVTFYSLSSSHR